jgi:DNA-binding transcriptional LysR family regulator
MEPENLDLRKLRAFQHVAEFGNLRQAATRLGVTVSAVSFSIQRLEKELGIALFDRLPNRMVLTPAGRRMAGASGAMFREINAVLASLAQPSTPQGSLTMAVSTDIGWYITPQLKAFSALYPDVALKVFVQRSSEALALVSRGDVELAIGRFRALEPSPDRAAPAAYKSLSIQPLVQTGFSLVCPPRHPLLRQRNALSIDAIAEYTLVMIGQHNSARRIIESAFLNVGGLPKTIIEAINCRQVIDFVEAGLGVGIVHSMCATPKGCRLAATSLDHYYGLMLFSILYKVGARKGATQSQPAAAMLKLLAGAHRVTDRR